MGKYRFRLETLRRLREIHRDELRSQLATAFEAERILNEQQAALAAEESALLRSQRDVMAQAPVDVNRLLAGQRYQLALESQARTLAGQAEMLAAEVDRRRAAVVEADREVRVLDKLEERQRRAHRQEGERAEFKRLDDIGAMRWKGAGQ
jgi:flagellar FliJ protein